MEFLNLKKTETIAESYIDSEEGVQITIIKTGFEDQYLVVFDDAEEVMLGKTYLMDKARVKSRYGIELQI